MVDQLPSVVSLMCDGQWANTCYLPSMPRIRRIRLRPGDREELERRVRARKTPQRRAERARIVLGSADGLSGRAMARRFGLSLPTVQRWVGRYDAEGLAGLEDRRRPGRPRTSVTPEVEAEVVRGTLEEDPPRGTHWSTRLMGAEAGLHHSQVARIWRAHGLKPHLTRTFKLSTDPEFVEKLRDVVGLYVDPPERAAVLAFDEKSRIQALDRTQPGLPLKRGRCGTWTHDYKRHGTTTLFAALNVATGEVIHRCMSRHRHREFLRFMREVEGRIDPALDLHVILDNHATHKHPRVRAWLRRHPRVTFHFTPTSTSWLNLVERFFSELTERQLRRLAVTSVGQLTDAITAYIDDRNRNPVPFKWTAAAEDILAKVSRANDTLETLH